MLMVVGHLVQDTGRIEALESFWKELACLDSLGPCRLPAVAPATPSVVPANGRLADECPNETLFTSLAQALY